MRKFLRLYALDIRKGLVLQWKRIVLFFILITCLLILNASYLDFDLSFGPNEEFGLDHLSYCDLLLSLFSGMDFYYPGSGMPFSLPVEWMFLVLMVLYLTLDYPTADLNSTGTTSLVVGSSRVLWWLSKCFWAVSVVLLLCGLILLSVLLVTVIHGAPISAVIHPGVLQALAFNTAGLCEEPWNIIGFLTLVPIILCAFALVQMFLSFATRPICGFALMAATLFLSAYYISCFLPGEYLMAARSSVFVTEGFFPEIGMMYALLLGLWAIVFGLLFFKKQDILGKEQQ